MLLAETGLLDRATLFFGGKGGVGKTTVAATMSLLAAQAGHRTLVVSTDPAHSTSDVFGLQLGREPREVADGLHALEIDPADEADRYISDVKRRLAEAVPERLAGEVERQIDIARVTPGAEESALFDRFTHVLRELGVTYDRIYFDTAPLGHTLRLLSLPELMSSWIRGLVARREKVNVLGRMWRSVAGVETAPDPVLTALRERQARFQETRAIVTDGRRAGFVFVVTPEHLPVAETERSVATLERYGIPVAAVVLNQVGDGGGTKRGQYASQVRERFAAIPLVEIPRLDRELHGVAALRDLSRFMSVTHTGV